MAFVVAALTITILMFVLSLGIAFAQERWAATMRARMAQVKRWGGAILILVGVWLIVLGIFADFFAQIFPV